ncbi:MAG TPA: nucleotide pyrophosphohydrolase, partial [Nitrospirae bacterium]|nr:nucleotide pyrophosphohydrolase [Nitrospirota bacterium]
EVEEMLGGEGRGGIEEEIADIIIYLTYLCNDLDIDLQEIVSRKLEINRKKYPSEKVKGSARKYTEYNK